MPPSPLHQALMKSDVESAKIYLTNPSAPTWCEETYHHYTPLAIACRRSDGPITDDLILKILSKCPRAAKIPIKSTHGDYPVHICAKYGAVSATVIEALLLEYPYAVEHKSQTSIGVMMNPQQLARGNNMLSESAKFALEQPLDHWATLKKYTMCSGHAEDRACEESVVAKRSSTKSRSSGRSSARSSKSDGRSSARSSTSSISDRDSRLQRRSFEPSHDNCNGNARTALLDKEMHRVQDDLKESKNTEAVLLTKLNALESKMEKLVLFNERAARRESATFRDFSRRLSDSTRRLSFTGAAVRRRSCEYIIGDTKQTRQESAAHHTAQRRGSIKSQRRGSHTSVSQGQGEAHRNKTPRKRHDAGVLSMFHRAKDEFTTSEMAREKVKQGAAATGAFIMENFV